MFLSFSMNGGVSEAFVMNSNLVPIRQNFAIRKPFSQFLKRRKEDSLKRSDCNSDNPNTTSPIDREIVFDIIMTTIDMDC
ncbi:uncharacterized protein [Blastocystis hominis]|uniref:Uncharacterized protein n=1 Tax=Blastocystis hominis TaxID=12968 RepID=D8MBJ8_BLAHO|nr:uncharacterized protein [Blastocystis hominis]CBK25437.2 unnamed protein product [Blastocystis hominis]|eukprot:XP_012899485.1 uncharacterized protein [Blastocystis hominis]